MPKRENGSDLREKVRLQVIHYRRSGGGADPSCLWNFTGVPRPSGRIGRARGRRRSNGGSDTGHVLGCTGYGANRRRRVVVRNSCVSRANGRPARLCAAYTECSRGRSPSEWKEAMRATADCDRIQRSSTADMEEESATSRTRNPTFLKSLCTVKLSRNNSPDTRCTFWPRAISINRRNNSVPRPCFWH